MSWKEVEEDMYQWTCDWKDCTATVTNSGRRGIFTSEVREVKPDDWSGVLITSMTDGDYCAVLCPDHSDGIKDNVVDRITPENNQVVGW